MSSSQAGIIYTYRFVAVLLILSFITALSLLHNPVLEDTVYYAIGGIVGYLMGMRLLLELAARESYQLRVKRLFLDPLVEDRPVRVKLIVENHSIIPLLYTEINDLYPELFTKMKGASTAAGLLPSRGGMELLYVVKPRLGTHVFRGTEVIIRDPVGLYAYRMVVPGSRETVRVYPKPLPLPRGAAARWVTSGLGLTPSRLTGIGQEFSTLREYVPGDDYRFIEWKSYARLRRLYVKQFEKEVSLSLAIILDASGPMRYGLLGKTPLEECARAAAGIARAVLEKGDWLTLYVRGPGGVLRSGYGRGRRHFRRVLDTLAGVSWRGEPSIGLAETLLVAAKEIPRRTKTLFIVFTSIRGEREAEELGPAIALLRSKGHPVLIVNPLPELWEAEEMRGIEAGLYIALAAEKLMRAREAGRVLARYGARVANVGPRDMVPAILRHIEALRAVVA